MTQPNADAAAPVPTTQDATTQALVEGASRLGLTWNLKLATVFSLVPVLAIMDGDSVPIPMTTITGVPVDTGLRVYVLVIPDGGNFIIGYAGEKQLAAAYTSVDAGNQITTSATPVNVQGPAASDISVTLAKKFSNTSLSIDLASSFFSTISATGPLYSVFVTGVGGVNANTYGSQHTIAKLNMVNSSVLSHTPVVGNLLLSGIDAGNAVITLRWLRETGSGSLNMNTDDPVRMRVTEVWV